MDKALAIIRGGRVELDAPVDWPDGTRIEVRPVCVPSNGDPCVTPAAPGVRQEFLDAMNDPDRIGLEESLWPQTPEERQLLLDHMAAAEPLDLTQDEWELMEQEREASKAFQKELTRKSWEELDRLFE
jgi:hypothetical protein